MPSVWRAPGGAILLGLNVLAARIATIVGVVVLTPLLYLPLWVLMPKDAAVTPSTAAP